MSDERLASGGEVGRYEIIEHFATGGMAEVYLARRNSIGGFQKTVILKTVRRSVLEDESFVKMFLDEARIAGSLSHPNIAAVYEADEIDGVAFIIMEFVPGPSAGRLIRQADREKKANRLAAAAIIAGAARGLHHAHTSTCGTGERSGLVHRDVSLDNILVSKDGIAKVIDFGIAKAKDRLSQTQNDVVKGKLAYMAPEQLESGNELDHRADVYSLGVCLYRATTGQFPFPQTSTSALLKARMKNTYTPPAEVVDDYPLPLAAVIERSMAADPSERYGSAREMADAIEGWIRSVDPDYDDVKIGAWVADVFPDETAWRPKRRVERTASELPATTGSGKSRAGLTTGSRSSPTLAPTDTGQHTTSGQHLTTPITVTTTPARLLAGTAVAGVVGLLAMLAVAAVLWVAWPSATVDTTPTPDARAAVYLDEAEKAGASGDWSLAKRLLDDARALPTTDPSLTVRVSKLANQVERGRELAGAREALARGDREEATKHARALLDSDPNDADATAILTELHKADAPVAGPTELVSFASEPDGATVFMDDVPLGQTPLTYQVALGRHEIWLRKGGYAAQGQPIEVAVGAPIAVKLTLDAVKVASAATPARKAASASTPVATVEEKPADAVVATIVEPPPVAPMAATPVVAPPAAPLVAAVVAAPPTPAAAPAAPTLDLSKRTALPARLRARSMDEVAATLAAIESALLQAGVPAASARGSTSLLAEDLLAGASPGSATDVYAQSVFDAIVGAWQLNLPAAKVKAAARRANHP